MLYLSSRFPGLGNLFERRESRFSRTGEFALLVDDEGCKVPDRVVFVETKIVVEQKQELLFHEVYLGEIEQGSISRPVLVFRRRVV